MNLIDHSSPLGRLRDSGGNEVSILVAIICGALCWIFIAEAISAASDFVEGFRIGWEAAR